MFDDISFLVNETFKDIEKNKSKGFLGGIFSKDEALPEDVCGLLYHIQKNAGTFVVRIHVSENIASDYENILKHSDLYPTLRFEADDDISSKLKYFECDDLAVAEKIKSKLSNKRFPLFEEQVFNLSDPGDSWWLKTEDTKLNIQFKLSHMDKVDNLIKLGPLGDPDRALQKLSGLYGYFDMLFPVEDFSCGFGQFSIETNDKNNPIFKAFKNIFKNGDAAVELWEHLRELEAVQRDQSVIESLKSANYFLIELAETRRFWLEVQKSI